MEVCLSVIVKRNIRLKIIGPSMNEELNHQLIQNLMFSLESDLNHIHESCVESRVRLNQSFGKPLHRKLNRFKTLERLD